MIFYINRTTYNHQIKVAVNRIDEKVMTQLTFAMTYLI